MFRIYLLIFLFGVSVAPAFAQNQRLIDSLALIAARPETPDSTKVAVLNKLAAQYMRFDMNNALAQLKKAEALTHTFSSAWSDSSCFMRHRAWVRFLSGNYHMRLGNTTDALANYLEALDLYQRTGFQRGIADALTGIGNCYYTQKVFDKAADHFTRAGAIFEKINFSEGMIVSYGNSASIRTEQKNFLESNRLLFKNEKIIAAKNITKHAGSNSYNIMTNYIRMDSFEKARYYGEKALQSLETSTDLATYANLMLDLSIIYYHEKDWLKAEKNALQSYETAQKIQAKLQIQDALNQLIKINLQKAQSAAAPAAKDSFFLKGFYYNELYLSWKDSINNSEKSKQLNELVVQYETAKKEKEISQLSAEAKFREIEILRSEVALRQEKLKSERAKEQALLFEKNNQNIALQLELNELKMNEQQIESLQKQTEIDLLNAENQQKIKLMQQERQVKYGLLAGLAAMALLLLMALRLYWQKYQAQQKIEKQTAEIEAQNARLEEANQFKSIFLSNMSHEIRTPLNTIIGVAELLTESDLRQREAGFATVIQQASKNLLYIINEILDFSKIEAGKIDFYPEIFDLHQSLHRLQSMMGVSAAQKNLSLELHIREDVPRQIKADPSRLHQILLNLVGNAVKFTEKGTISIKAVVESVLPGDQVLLRFVVTDTGTGISAADLPHIFDTFRQAGENTHLRHDGTGLGLAISKQLVELQGGQIGVESIPGTGSLFYFTLPVAAISDSQLATEPILATLEKLPAKRILLVEDNQFNQMLAVELFKKIIHHPDIIIAGDGSDAIIKTVSGNYDVIFMDIKMPVMDGYTATQRIRASGITTPIIALTANATSEEKERCLLEGMNDYLSKPIDVKRLRELLEKWG